RGHARPHRLEHEGSLADVRARPARRHQLLVRQHHRSAVDAERAGEVAACRKLEAWRQYALTDQPLQLSLDLPGQWHRALAIDGDVHGPTQPFWPTKRRRQWPIGMVGAVQFRAV